MNTPTTTVLPGGIGTAPVAEARAAVAQRLRQAAVIPAHPLALDEEGGFDGRAQRALSSYYLEAGAGGLAVGVHTTQFALHDDMGLLTEVWQLAADVAAGTETSPGEDPPLLIAGICGDAAEAMEEASRARDLGYEVALLCSSGMTSTEESAMLDRVRAVGDVMPVIGFYMQDAVGGQKLGREFWRDLFDIETVIGAKVAPFDRYRTNDLARALAEHDRRQDVVLLTGNDDAIVLDLLSPYRVAADDDQNPVRVAGGLLGQWAVGTRAAVQLTRQVLDTAVAGSVPSELLQTSSDLVEVNAAVFDVDHGFAGCIAGVNEVLRQQGLLSSAACLDGETLSPGQADRITRVRREFPQLLDEEFIASRRDAWLG